jgi:hypothetical protein
MKTYGEANVEIHVFLTSALVGGEWSDSHTSRFAPRERGAGTHWIGGWVGDVGGKSCSYRDSNSDPSAVQPVASRYTDCAIPALFVLCIEEKHFLCHSRESNPDSSVVQPIV